MANEKFIHLIEVMAFYTGVLGVAGVAGSWEMGDLKGMAIAAMLCVITALLALIRAEVKNNVFLSKQLKKSFDRNRIIVAALEHESKCRR